MENSISFFLNGKKVVIDNPAVDTLLIDYLRSPEVHLSGPKKPCGQGGCGGCTVILSHLNSETNKPEHLAINSCLRPLIAVDGMSVTTIEGTGAARRPNPEFLSHTPVASRAAMPAEMPVPESVTEAYEESQAKRKEVFMAIDKAEKRTANQKILLKSEGLEHPTQITQLGVNPVAHRLAINNGTQCGYCTVGFVMNMSEFIANNPKATKKEIENIFDGNICRCTGYRSILTGMKTFASDWTKKDEEERMKCIGDDEVESQLPASAIVIPFPDEAREPLEPSEGENGDRHWLRPGSLQALLDDLKKYKDDDPYIIHGNTSYGIYKEDFLNAKVVIDIRLVPELNFKPVVREEYIRVSSGTTYSEFITIVSNALSKFSKNIPRGRDPETTSWGSALFMAHRTAGRIVRNAASLGGNSMLVLKHIAAGTGAPFPSDLFTALAANGTTIEWMDPHGESSAIITRNTVEELCKLVVDDNDLAKRIIIAGYEIPFGTKQDVLLAQKVALREVNAHSIVNSASSITTNSSHNILKAQIIFGGIAPYPWAAVNTEKLLIGQKLSLANIPGWVRALSKEVKDALRKWASRMAGLPDEGFTDEYRIDLATAFFYKSIIKAMIENGMTVPKDIQSSATITFGRWPLSNGLQFYKSQSFKAPVSQPYIKFTAMEQAQGQLHYTHEYAVPLNTVFGSLVQSKKALASFFFTISGKKTKVSTGELREHLSKKFPAFVDIVTSEAFKNGATNLQGMGSDQPIFTPAEVRYVGQSIALVGAKSEQDANNISDYVSDQCIGYAPANLGNKKWDKPIIGLDAALDIGSIFPDWPKSASFNSHIWRITRPGSQLGWMTDKKPLDKKIVNRAAIVDGNKCRIVESTQLTGGQAHFYMETQAAVVKPADGGRFIVYSSTQSPATVHGSVAPALGIQYNAVDVRVPPVGGGFGGKTEPSRFVTAAAAVAAKAMKRPVRLVLTREQDTAMIGKRHGYYSQYQVAIDTGDTAEINKGIIHGLSNKMWGDGGAFYDCSFIVSNCIITRGDNAYRINNFQAQIDVCRTNTAPSTAFRAFGDVQGKVMLENAIDDAAFTIGMRAEEVREKNLYDRGDVTPFGQPLSYCYMKEVWKYVKQVSAYDKKLAEVRAFNEKNKWRKRGISIVPVKYGSGYNLVMLEQAGAIVSIYQGDGSIIIHQGGVEMGQGLLTVAKQVASYFLNVPMSLIEVESPKTSIITNPTSTGASTGTTYSAEAIKRVCQILYSRLTDFGYDMLKQNGNDWCMKQGIDFWNHGEKGWSAAAGKKLIWQNLVAMAYQQRINLTASLQVPMTGGETPVPNLSYKPANEQPIIPDIPFDEKGQPGEFDSFSGFTYSAACTVAEVDILTGETKILSSDLVYDIGWSMNPAIDVGQVEGAFVQGLGYVLSEKLVFEPEGPDKGRLNTLNTWTYKPPAITTIPLEFNVHLFPRELAPSVPESPSDVLSSKEVGEPPLVLAVTAFFAIKDAVRASRLERKLPGLFRLDSPATVQEVRRACDVSDKDLMS